LYVLLLLMYGMAWAVPPADVYRVDARPPGEIFKDGFKAWGSNGDLLAHILGTSLTRTGDEGSSFVATTETLEAAYRIIQRMYENDLALRRTNFYIYEIRADQTFYQVDRYLESLERNPPAGQNRRGIAEVRRAYRYEREWVAAGGIPARQVRLAREVHFDRDTGRVVDLAEQSNDDYNGADTHGNTEVYRGPQRVLGRQAFILNSTVEFLRGFAVTLAYCPLPQAGERKVRFITAGGCGNPTVVHLDRDLTGLTEILPILLYED